MDGWRWGLSRALLIPCISLSSEVAFPVREVWDWSEWLFCYVILSVVKSLQNVYSFSSGISQYIRLFE